MADIPGNFNASAHDDMNDYSAIPPGEYIAQIVKSEMKLTKKAQNANDPSKGQYLFLNFRVVAGKFKGKNLFTNLNLVNENQQAVEIAQRELATISRACGINGRVKQSEQLHGIPIKVKVDVETSSYGERNNITMYAPAGDGAPSEPVEDVADDAPKSDDGGKKKRPWD